jgi:hypothetical protein
VNRARAQESRAGARAPRAGGARGVVSAMEPFIGNLGEWLFTVDADKWEKVAEREREATAKAEQQARR